MSLASGQTVGPAGHCLHPRTSPSWTKQMHWPQSVQVIWEMGQGRELPWAALGSDPVMLPRSCPTRLVRFYYPPGDLARLTFGHEL